MANPRVSDFSANRAHNPEGPDDPNSDQTDTDGDGTGDACNLCPLDPNKIEPGICDCGLLDEPDTDGDGMPNDCNGDCEDNGLDLQCIVNELLGV